MTVVMLFIFYRRISLQYVKQTERDTVMILTHTTTSLALA